MFSPLSPTLENLLNQCLIQSRNSLDKRGSFLSTNCLSENGTPIDIMHFQELCNRGYLKRISGDIVGIFEPTSNAETYEETKKMFEQKGEFNVQNLTIINSQNGIVLNQQGNNNSTQEMTIHDPVEIEKLFKSLLNIVENDLLSIESSENINTIKNSILEMKEAIDKPIFKDKYEAFMQSTANHVTIFSPFIPLLKLLLTSGQQM